MKLDSHRPFHRLRRIVRRSALLTILFVTSAVPALAQVNTSYEGIALSDRSPVEVVLYLLAWVLGILAIFAVVLVLYGGFVWMTSGGNEEKVANAKAILKNALIGLLIILSAWGIVLWLLGVISDATGTSTIMPCSGYGCISGDFTPSGYDYYVLATNPSNGDSGVYLCTDVTIRVNRHVDQDSVTADSFYIINDDGTLYDGDECTSHDECVSSTCTDEDEDGTYNCVGDTVPGDIGFGPGDSTYYFNIVPDEDFAEDTNYHVYLTSDIMSEDDTPDDEVDDRYALTAYDFTFITGTETDVIPPTVQENSESPFPADEETNVCLNTVVSVDFSESMRITSFNDDESFLVDEAGVWEEGDPETMPDWTDARELNGWSFGSQFDYAMVRPASALDEYTWYGFRLYAGDADNDFEGAITDSCGNPLDGNYDVVSEGATVDNFWGYDPDAGESEDSILWETGENSECTPIIESFTPPAWWYGEYAGLLMEGEACTYDYECASQDCDGGFCVGEPAYGLLITGLYLIPHPEVWFEGSRIYAAEGTNSCFNVDHFGNLTSDTSVGDECIGSFGICDGLVDGHEVLCDTNQDCENEGAGTECDNPYTSNTELRTMIPVGTKPDQNFRISVADVPSAYSDDTVGLEDNQPYISWLNPDDGAVGQYMTIIGENFGETTGTVVMRMIQEDGVVRTSELVLPEECGDVSEPEEILAIVPEEYTDSDGGTGTWATGDVAMVQVIHNEGENESMAREGYYSNWRSFTFSTTTRPNLCSVVSVENELADPSNCDISGGKDVYVTGDSFGDDQGDSTIYMTTSEYVEYEPSAVDSWIDSQVDFTTSGDMGNDTYYVVVSHEELGNSNMRSYYIPCTSGPQVVEWGTCDEDEDIYPIPNPQPNQTDACRNGIIAVLFDQEVSGLTYDVGGTGTVRIQKYNEGDSFDESATPSDISGSLDTGYTVYVNDTYYYGFKFTPASNMDQNTWYKVTLSTGISSLDDGVPMAEEYTYTFKVDDTEDTCEATNIVVDPSWTIENEYGDSEDFDGTAVSDCNLINPNSMTWSWTIDDEDIGTFSPGQPDSDAEETVYVAGNDEENEGTTYVRTTVGELEDDAAFVVDLGFCESDEDCESCPGSTCNEETSHCTPVVIDTASQSSPPNDPSTRDFTPLNGAQGTWVTIYGCMFGSAKGNVWWNSDDDLVHAETEWPDSELCEDTWTSEYIIAEVPEDWDADDDDIRETAVDNGTYDIEVETRYGDSDESDYDDFEINDTPRAGICKISPDDGPEGTSTYTAGQMMGEDEGWSSWIDKDDDRLSGEVTSWSDTLVYSIVPDGATNSVSKDYRVITAEGDETSCADDTYCSNTLDYTVTCSWNRECNSGCCNIDTPYGECISGDEADAYCNACETDDDCTECGGDSSCVDGYCTPVIEEISPARQGNDSAITIDGCYFGSSKGSGSVSVGGIEPEYPCGNESWSNTQIIVTVPGEDEIAPEQSVDVTVTSRFELTTEASPLYVEEQCVDAPEEGVPILCALNPNSGDGHDTVWFSGINFYDPDAVGETDTLNNIFAHPDGPTAGDNFAYISDEMTSAEVPVNDEDLAASGDAYAEANSCDSNGINFYIHCEDGEDCPPGSDCVDGVCTPAECTADDDCPDPDDECIDGECTTPCETHEDCDGDEVCVDGTCEESCTETGDCDHGFDCVEGVCTDMYCAECFDGDVVDNDQCPAYRGCYWADDLGAIDDPANWCCDWRPTFVSSNPSDGETGICPNRWFTITFSEEMKFTTSKCDNEDVNDDGYIDDQDLVNVDDDADGDYTDEDHNCDHNGDGVVDGNDTAEFNIDIEQLAGTGTCDGGYCDGGAHDGEDCSADATLCEQDEDTVITEIDIATMIQQADDSGTCVANVCDGGYYDGADCTDDPELCEFSETYTTRLRVEPGAFVTGAQYRMTLNSENDYFQDESTVDTSSIRSVDSGLALRDGTEIVTIELQNDFCLPTQVELINDDTGKRHHTFTEPNGSTSYTATVLASDGQELYSTDEMGWEFTWDPYYDEDSCENIAWVEVAEVEEFETSCDIHADCGDNQRCIENVCLDLCDETADCGSGEICTYGHHCMTPDATSETQAVVSGEENHDSTSLSATISPLTGWTGSITGKSRLSVTYCEESVIWEYIDDEDPSADSKYYEFVSRGTPEYEQNFRLIYCMDDDTPEMDNIVVNEGGGDDDWFLQYLFSNSDNPEQVFGIRVFDNEYNLSPEEWYETFVDEDGSISDTTIDGYYAGTTGDTYYIAAGNIIQDSNPADDSLYNNMYVFSFDTEADGMENIESQVMDYLMFNHDLDYGDCDASDKDKLTRDTNRVNDFGTLAVHISEYITEEGATEYPYPQSDEYGSYIEELTTSVWSSWQGAVGNIYGVTLPTDPYNFFYAADQDDPWNAGDEPWIYDEGLGDETTDGDCEYDADLNEYWDESGTCWDPVNTEFYCPEHSHTYMYKVDPADSTNLYLYSHMEYDGSADGTEDWIHGDYTPCTDATVTAECACYNYGLESIGMGNWAESTP